MPPTLFTEITRALANTGITVRAAINAALQDLEDAILTKQNSLGFTPENVVNKSTDGSLGASDTLYPSQKAVKTYADTKAPSSKGVTNGDTHDHSGGDGAQIDHGGLAGLADDDHTQYIKHALATAANDFLVASGSGAFVKKTLAEALTILGKAAASGLASLDGSSKVLQDPANATATPTASKIPIADGSGKLDGWVTTTFPTGSVLAWPTSTVPSGFLECDGSAVSKTTYAALYAVLKDGGASCIYGEGATFNLPDYRGRFLRGWAHGQTTDPDKAARTDRGDGTGGDVVGSKQDHQVGSHAHTIDDNNIVTYNNVAGTYYATVGGSGTMSAVNHINDTGGNETRPINIDVMYIIKY